MHQATCNAGSRQAAIQAAINIAFKQRTFSSFRPIKSNIARDEFSSLLKEESSGLEQALKVKKKKQQQQQQKSKTLNVNMRKFYYWGGAQ